MKKRQMAIRYHHLLAGTSSCSRPLCLSRQSKESSTSAIGPTSVMKKKYEQVSSVIRSACAHQLQSQRIPLLLGGVDKQEDVPGSSMAADGDDNDRDTEQHRPIIKLDDLREFTSDARNACDPLITNKHVDGHGDDRTMALIVRPATDGKERRYGDRVRLSAHQSYVIVHSPWFDDAVPRECHLANYESANQDSRQRPLSVSLQTIRKQLMETTSKDNLRLLLDTCWQYIRPRYSLTFESAVFSSFIANSSDVFRRTDQYSSRCNDPSVWTISSLSFEVVGTPSVIATSPLAFLTTECSVGIRAMGEISPARNKYYSRETTSPTHDIATTARCYETTAVMRTTSIVSLSDELHQVVKVLPSSAADKQTFVGPEGECITEASTSLFVATAAKCSKNQHNKIRYKYMRRCKLCQNCQRTKKLPKKRHKESPTDRQYYSMIRQIHDKVEEIYTSCKSSEDECKRKLESMQRLLRQNWIEQFWTQGILQQIGIQISQSENNATVSLSHAQRSNSTGIKTTYAQKAYSRASEPGSVKSTKLSTESAHIQSSSLGSALGLAESHKKPRGQLPSFIQLQDVREDTSKANSITIKATSPKSSKSSSFQNLPTSSSQNYRYMHRIPAVCMARTKQTARKSRDDRQEEDRQRDRDRSESPPRGRGRSPVPRSYTCVFCWKVKKQRTNHRRHLVMQHSCRLDGTPATEEDFEQARRWSAKEATGRSSRYKSEEFVDSDVRVP